MARLMKREAKRPRISLDVASAVCRRIRLAAAKREVSVHQYDQKNRWHNLLRRERESELQHRFEL